MPAETGRLVGLLRAALLYRYDLSRLRGWAFLAVSIFDVLLYAAAISLVMGSVFGLSGTQRLVQMLIGLIAFRWSLSCAIHASRVAFFVRVAQPFHRFPVITTMILAIASPTLVFAVSIFALSVTLFVLTSRSLSDFVHMFAWGSLVVLVHLSWNVALVLALILGRLRGWLQSEVPPIVFLALMLVLSPVAYLFSDIPAAASQVLTRFNPASHLIAAYQNAFWYLKPLSLEVLPASFIVMVGVAGLLTMAVRSSYGTEYPVALGATLATWRRGVGWLPSHNVLAEAGAVVSPWRGELPWLSGRNMLRLLIQPDGDAAVAIRLFERIAKRADSDHILDVAVPIYSERTRDKLASIAALQIRGSAVAIDRLLDNQLPGEIAAFSEIVAMHSDRPISLSVISTHDQTVHALLSWRPENY